MATRELCHEIQVAACGFVFDSTAALGVIKRRGNRRMKHVGGGQLWIQEEEEGEELKIRKVHVHQARAGEDFGRTDSNEELQACQWEKRKCLII